MRNLKIFIRSFYITAVISFCLIFAILGISKAYSGIRLIGFGEYRDAVEITDEEIKFFDFSISLRLPLTFTQGRQITKQFTTPITSSLLIFRSDR